MVFAHFDALDFLLVAHEIQIADFASIFLQKFDACAKRILVSKADDLTAVGTYQKGCNR